MVESSWPTPLDLDAAPYENPRGTGLLSAVALIGLIAAASAVWLASGTAADATAIVLLFVVSLAALPLFALAARGDPEPALFHVLALAWAVRLIGMGGKLYIFHVVASGNADAANYHEAGQAIAQALAAGQWPSLEHFWGTKFVELVTGMLYAVTGPSFIGGWIVFNFFGFLGMLLHYKAFVTAVPFGRRRLFMTMIFFAPTLVMWTNEVGKDALSALCLGMATYGVARLYRQGPGLGRLIWTLLGVGGLTLVRPQMGPLVVVALTAALLVVPVRAGILGSFVKLAVLAATVILAVVVVRTAASFLNLDDLSVEGLTSFVEEKGGDNSQQGSLAFAGGGLPTSPQAIGLAILTVLFRPFPWETRNLLILVTSLEGFALMSLLLLRIKTVWAALADARRHAYLAYAAVFIALFIAVFSTISNFGILIRQRAQVLPFIFIWLAYESSRARGEPEPEGFIS